MQYKFNAYGHPNILAMHKTTSEFTKDNELSLKGDCIVGIRADFELKEIEKFIKKSKNKKISITIKTISKNKKIKDMILAELNPNFCDDKELVIRKTDFISRRTFAIKANKSAFELNMDLIRFLNGKNSKISVILENKE